MVHFMYISNCVPYLTTQLYNFFWIILFCGFFFQQLISTWFFLLNTGYIFHNSLYHILSIWILFQYVCLEFIKKICNGITLVSRYSTELFFLWITLSSGLYFQQLISIDLFIFILHIVFHKNFVSCIVFHNGLDIIDRDRGPGWAIAHPAFGYLCIKSRNLLSQLI